MGEELSLNNATMYIDGKPIGNATNISAKILEPKKNHSFEFANRIMPGRLDIGLNRKLRVKKKLYNRIVKL